MESEILLYVTLEGKYCPAEKGCPLTMADAGTPDFPSDIEDFQVMLGKIDISSELTADQLENLKVELIASYED